jgi:hypothetical protein
VKSFDPYWSIPQNLQNLLMEEFSETALSMYKKSKSKGLKKTGLSILDQEMKNDFRGGQILEIYSSLQTKSLESLMMTMVYAVIPEEFEGIELGGSNMTVFYFDNDYNFYLWRFITIMENVINRAISVGLGQQEASPEAIFALFKGKGNFEAFLQKCMSRVKVFHCKNGFEYWMTLEGIRLSEGKTFSLIVVNSLNSYHHSDKISNDRASLCLLKIVAQGIAVICTKYPLYHSNKRSLEYTQQQEIMPQAWISAVTYRLFLEDSGAKLQSVKEKIQSEVYHFKLAPSGIQFLKK